MSRDLKRVALDFAWPLNKPWKGFLLPDELQGERCEECDGSGQTKAAWWIQHLSQRIDMLTQDIVAQEKGDRMHPWLEEDPYPPTMMRIEDGLFRHQEVMRPSDDILELMSALSGESPEYFRSPLRGTSYTVFRALIEASGLEGWGTCKACEDGRIEQYKGQFAERDAWQPYEPPTGEGWQMWESVSEGSPVSPVFATSEELVDWLISADAGYYGMSKAGAEALIEDGWMPTAVFVAEPEPK